MKNSIGLRFIPLKDLKIGETVILGPYKSANVVTAKMAQVGDKAKKFNQKQVLLVDPVDATVLKMYLVTRTK